MSSLRSFHYLPPYFAQKYGEFDWFWGLVGYLEYRYMTISNRFWETFRYVDPSRDHAEVYSYEYASLLRDIGSVFASVLDTLIKNTGNVKKELSIGDYRRFLIENVEEFESVGVQFHLPFKSKYFFPFENGRLAWWNGYNNVKHSDSTKYTDGCLSNVLYGLASLSIIYQLVNQKGDPQYCLVGFFGGGPDEDIYPVHVDKL